MRLQNRRRRSSGRACGFRFPFPRRARRPQGGFPDRSEGRLRGRAGLARRHRRRRNARRCPRLLRRRPRGKDRRDRENRPRRRPPLGMGISVAVVSRAFVGIDEDVVGLGNFLEVLLGLAVPRIAVRVVFHGELAVGALDFLGGGAAGNPENLVGVGALARRHGGARRDPWRRRRSPGGAGGRAVCIRVGSGAAPAPRELQDRVRARRPP